MLPRLVDHVLHVAVDGLLVGVMRQCDEGHGRGAVMGDGRGEGVSGPLIVFLPVFGVKVED